MRDTYDLGDKLVIVTTDRQSAFDRLLAAIPFKGQVLNQTSAWWMRQAPHIVGNALLAGAGAQHAWQARRGRQGWPSAPASRARSLCTAAPPATPPPPPASPPVPDANACIMRKCSVFPVEFVCRGFMTGSTDTSLWTHYKAGERVYCGNNFPDGMRKNDRLAQVGAGAGAGAGAGMGGGWPGWRLQAAQ